MPKFKHLLLAAVAVVVVLIGAGFNLQNSTRPAFAASFAPGAIYCPDLSTFNDFTYILPVTTEAHCYIINATDVGSPAPTAIDVTPKDSTDPPDITVTGNLVSCPPPFAAESGPCYEFRYTPPASHCDTGPIAYGSDNSNHANNDIVDDAALGHPLKAAHFAYYLADGSALKTDCGGSTATLTTAIHDAAHGVVTSVTAGDVIHDSFTSTGTAPAGSVVHTNLYPSGDCSGTPIAAGSSGSIAFPDRAFAASVDPSTPSHTTTTADIATGLSYKAFLLDSSGNPVLDASGAPIVSACEPFTVKSNKVIAGAQTATFKDGALVSDTTFALGDSVHDVLELTGSGTIPAGSTLKFQLLKNPGTECAIVDGTTIVKTSTPDPSGDTLPVNIASDSSGPLGAGSYAYLVTFTSGDASAFALDPPGPFCEPFSVNKAKLGITTDVHDADHNGITNVPLGSIVHDTANVTGGVSPFATPAVTFTIASPLTPCADGESIGTDPNPDAVALRPRSVDTAPLAAGSWAFQATVDSDGNYDGATSDCEPFTVDQAHLKIHSEVHYTGLLGDTIAPVAGIPLGSVAHDTANVTGGVSGFPTPAVSFFYGNSGTGCEIPGIGTSEDPDDLNGDPRSVDTGALGAGSYRFHASVAGDNNYIGADSGCEGFTVNKGSLSVSSTVDRDDTDAAVAGSLPLGTKTHDHALVIGAIASPAPSALVVSFTLAGPSPTACDGAGAAVATLAVSADPGYESAASAALGAGGYAYHASITDALDPNYVIDVADSGCEGFTVNKGDLTISTIIHNANHNPVTSVPSGSIVHDTGTLAGIVGTIYPDLTKTSFTFFRNGTCAPTGSDAGNSGAEPLTSKTTARSGPSAALAGGSYSYLAVFTGDANYNPTPTPAAKDCEPLSVFQLGFTKGFWGNQNGQARIASTFTYKLGTYSSLCYVDINTKAKTLTVLPSSNNGLSISSNCTAMDAGLSNGAVNNLLGQVLALRLNQTYVSGYSANTVGSLGCTLTPGLTAGGLTAASTIQQVLDYANGIIGNLKNGGVVVTPTQVGDLNSLLGDCMNRET